MKQSSEYPEWEFLPNKLSREEAANPYLVIDSFFDYASLPQMRDKLWTWLEVAVTGNFPKNLSRLERNNFIDFYLQLEKLVESAHIIHNSPKNGKIKGKKGK